MKFLLGAIVTLVSVMAIADIPRPRPRPDIEPGPVRNLDAASLNALVYGASAAKLAELKAGSTTMVVQIQNLSSEVSRFIYTSRNCPQVINACLENKQMTVTKTVQAGAGRTVVTFKASEVMRLR